MKDLLRARVLAAIRSRIPLDDEPARISRQLEALPSWVAGLRVAAYRAIEGEPSVDPALQLARARGAAIAFPRLHEVDLEFVNVAGASAWHRSSLGVEEPDGPALPPAAAFDVALVPGVAFTEAGDRLGRGGGHYDRFLARRTVEVAIGVCYDEAVVPEIPVEAHDVRVQYVVTPNRVFVAQP